MADNDMPYVQPFSALDATKVAYAGGKGRPSHVCSRLVCQSHQGVSSVLRPAPLSLQRSTCHPRTALMPYVRCAHGITPGCT